MGLFTLQFHGVLFALGAILTCVARAAEEPTKPYDIPTGFAEQTLKGFAAQSEREVIYSSAAVRGVRTNPIKGNFGVKEALALMLAGTPLYVASGDPEGVLRIARASDPNGVRAARSTSDRPKAETNETLANHPKTMKPSIRIAAFSTWLTLLLSPSLAVATEASPFGTAIIRGQVSNSATRSVLEGAAVQVAGTDRTVLTNREGRYEISVGSAETTTLEVSYTGLTTQRIPVAVSAGRDVVVNVGMASDTYVMDKFTVAGIREGQALAITQQRNAPNVKNVVAADAFGNVADNNGAEVLRLLPGISTFNSENESRYVMVRGIDANLNIVTVDGMKIGGGTGATDRQIELPGIPVGAMQIIEVTKSPTPDMDGDSIGGNINFRPASIFDRTDPRRITFAVSGSTRKVGDGVRSTAYTSNKVSPTFGFGYSNVFGANRNFGVSLNLSHTLFWAPGGGILLAAYQTTAASPAYMQSLTSYDYHYLERTRSSADLRLDFKVSDSSKLYFSSYYTYYDSQQTFHGGNNSVSGTNAVITLDAAGRPIPFQPQFPFGDPGYRPGGFNAAGARVLASIMPGYTDKVTEIVNGSYSFQNAPIHVLSERIAFQGGGLHQFGQFEVDYAVNHQLAPTKSGQKDWDENATSRTVITVPNTSWRLDGTETDSIVRRRITQTGGPDVWDPANWVLSGLRADVVRVRTRIYGGQINLKQSFSAPIPTFIKTGLKYMSEERKSTRPNKTFNYSGPQGAFLANFIDTTLPTGVPLDKWHPFGRSPQFLDLDKVNDYLRANPQVIAQDAALSLQNQLANDKRGEERVYAGYLMGNVALGRLGILGGVRFEKTSLAGETSVQDPRAGLTLTDPIERTRAQWGTRSTVTREYSNVLPGLHFKYEPGRDWVMRASYSQSFGRPTFGSIYPDTRINYETERITQNNPGAKPQDAANFDVSLEHYFEPIGVISAGVFLKEIKNFLFSNVVKIPQGPDNGFDGDFVGWDLSTQANGGFARVRGAELNYSQQLSFLPGVWGGFGVFANYTWLDTNGNYGRVTEPEGSSLVNFTPRTANAGVSFDRKRFYARVNVNYTGTYMRSYNVNPLLRSYQDRRTMVDTKLGFRYSPNITVFADVANLFNSKQKWYNGYDRERVVDHRDHGVRLQAGVNGAF